MNITCGTDIIEIERIKEAIEDALGEKFVKRVFTPKEIEYCEAKNKMKYQHYAARFAAKEAVFKAISSRLNSDGDIPWTNIEISNSESGKPSVEFINTKIPNLSSCDISLSHCKQYATANAIAIFED